MQKTPRNIGTKFASNWSSNVREEVFWKIINNDDDQHLVMAIVHMAFGQVS